MHRSLLNPIYVILILMLIGFAGFYMVQSYTANKSQSKKDAMHTHSNDEVLQIGTDLDISKLSAINDLFYQKYNVQIKWVPITVNKTYLSNVDEPLNDPLKPSLTLNTGITEGENKQYGDLKSSQPSKVYRPKNFETNFQFDSALKLIKPLPVPKEVDVLLMQSANSLYGASLNGQLQPIGLTALIDNVPKQYQDPNGYWFGVTYYARAFVFNKTKVNAAELVNYAGMANGKWRDRFCMTHPYLYDNQAIARVLATHRSSEKASEVLGGWVRNAGKPDTSDNQVILNIERGHCDVGIADSHVFWQYAKNNPKTNVRLSWANQINNGAVTNVVATGVVKNAYNITEALKFVEWLVSNEGQASLAFYTSTFPIKEINDDRINHQAVRPKWTIFKPDTIPLYEIMDSKTVINPTQADALTESSYALKTY